MADIHSQKDIEKVSLEILRGSNSLNVFPTPIDKIVAYSELVIRNDIDVSKIHSGYLSRATDALRRALSKVRGLLDRTHKTIYLDLEQGVSRKNFVTLHEVGHDVLPWQKKFHDILDDDDKSLDPSITRKPLAALNNLR